MKIRQSINKIFRDDEFQKLELKLQEESIFSILEIERKELVHSSLLSWLLDPLAQHGMGDTPLKTFLLMCSEIVSNDIDNDSEKFIDAVIIDNMDFNKIKVVKEYKTDSSICNGRLDILVAYDPKGIFNGIDPICPILIVEYKIESEENNDQTSRYVAWSNAQPKFENNYSAFHI